MWKPIAVFLFATMIPAYSQAQESVSEEAQSPEQLFEQIEKAYQDAYNKFMTAYRGAEDDAARSQALEQLLPDPNEYSTKFLEVVDLDPKSVGAFKASQWILSNVQNGDAFKRSLGTIQEHHMDRDDLMMIVRSLSRSFSADAASFLETVADAHEKAEVRAHALFGLGNYYSSQPDMIRMVKSAPEEQIASMEDYFGKAWLDKARQMSDEDLAEFATKAEEYFAAVAEDEAYASVDAGRGGTLGDMAKNSLFEIRHLSIGKVAPEIEGSDADGVAFKLSEYRGKVVMLDFWGDW